jgi:hypothetical protein
MIVAYLPRLCRICGLSVTAIAMLTGCVTIPSQKAPQPREISYEEASAFERSLLARGSVPVPDRNGPLHYIQPANKKEACKLPTTQDQLDRQNFRAYWDGECKNGFAFGLGRDIAISDTHHQDEITIHDGSGDNLLAPSAGYDYVNNRMSYRVGGSKYPAITRLIEHMDNAVSGLNVTQQLVVTDESGNGFGVQTYAFHPMRKFRNTRSGGVISYSVDDNSATPVPKPNDAIFIAEIRDPQNNQQPGGVAFVRFGNGTVRHFKIGNGTNEPISLPAAYIEHLKSKHKEVFDATSGATATLERAKQIEREYLFKACNGKSGIDGLDKAIYTKICTWRDQFKEPYAIASAKYQRQLEKLKEEAATAEQQSQVRQQNAQQQQMLRQQQEQQQKQAYRQSMDELGNSIERSTQQTYQQIQAMPQLNNPFGNPFGQTDRNKTNCVTVGRNTMCNHDDGSRTNCTTVGQNTVCN